MEHFFRHDQRTIKKAFFFAVVFLTATINSSAFSADKSSQASATLDFANGLYARKMYGPAIAEYEKFIRTNPDSPDVAAARFRYADSYYFTKDYASAIAHFDVFIRKFPEDKRVEMAQFRLGTARFNQGDRAQAIRSFVRLSREAVDPLVKSGASFYLAKCLEEKGKSPDRVLRILQHIVDSSPDSEYASYAGVAIGDHHIKLEALNEARAGYEAAARNTEPQELTRQARFKVAEIFFTQDKFTEASAFYQKVYEEPIVDTYKGKALLGLFYCDYHRQDLTGASGRYSTVKPFLETSAERDEILFLLVSLNADHEKYDEALKLADEVILSKTVSDELREKTQFKKIAILSEAGRKEDSLSELERHFGQGKKNEDRALFEKGQLFSQIGKTDEALAAFERILKEYPKSEHVKNALYQAALARMKAGRAEEAKKTFKEYATRYAADPNADLALLQIIQIDLDAKKFLEAFNAAEAFIQANPQSQRLDIAHYKLGVAAAGLNRFGQAAFSFQKLVDNYPESKLYVEALYGAAVSLENAKKIPEAIALNEQILRDFPDHAISQEVRPRLGYLYIQNQDAGKALTYYEDLIFDRKDVPLETDGVFWIVQYLLDQSLYDRLDRILDGLEARFPGKDLSHEKFFFKGESALGAKDYDKAQDLYQKAIQASAEGAYIAHAHLGRGIALTLLGRDAEAETSFGEALTFDHELKIAMRARFELANLQVKARRLDEAAKAFMMVAILYDDPKYTPPSLYKAGECYRSLGKTEDANKVFMELKTKYPDSEWASRI